MVCRVISDEQARPLIAFKGTVHPKVTNCRAQHKAFNILKEAEDWLRKLGVEIWTKDYKDCDINTTPLKGSNAFYAVANGCTPGVYEYYHGRLGANELVDKYSGNCHKHFRTRLQADEFIQDWIESYSDVFKRRLVRRLKGGWRWQELRTNSASGESMDVAIIADALGSVYISERTQAGQEVQYDPVDNSLTNL